jgi:hypothetical protein
VPFDFLKRKKIVPDPVSVVPVTKAPPRAAPAPAPAAGATSSSGGTAVPAALSSDPPIPAATGRGIPFDALTEEWRLVGRMAVEGRLSDTLNRREPIEITEVLWAPLDGSEAFKEAPGLKAIDPYDLILVLAGETSLPSMSTDEAAAHRIHKVSYDLLLEAPPYRIIGTVHLYPGTDPLRLLDRSSEMFVPVVHGRASMGELAIGTDADVILVNRLYLRGVEQVDRSTGERAAPIPGLKPGADPGRAADGAEGADEGADEV